MLLPQLLCTQLCSLDERAVSRRSDYACTVSFGGGRLRIGLLLHALFAFERERYGLLLAIRVNGALGLENFESVSLGFRQILMSRLICKRAIVVRNLGVPKRRPGAPPFREGTVRVASVGLGYISKYKLRF